VDDRGERHPARGDAEGGAFVMNTREEISQALHELREGTFIKG
jgi:redox-sensitive bicupin YhaK (pirin superfamily)